MNKILFMETHQIVVELIKAILVGSFLFCLFHILKKSFLIGKSLNSFLLINKLELQPKYKRKITSKIIIKFISFSHFEEEKMIEYLNKEIILSNDFLNNLIPLKDLK